MEHRYTSLILTEKNRLVFTINGDFSSHLILGIVIGYFAVQGLGADDRSFDIIRDDHETLHVTHPDEIYGEVSRKYDRWEINKEQTIELIPPNTYGLWLNRQYQWYHSLYSFYPQEALQEFLQGLLSMIRFYNLEPEDIIMYLPMKDAISYAIDIAPNLRPVPTAVEQQILQDQEDDDNNEDNEE